MSQRIADRRMYATADGLLCDESDPRAAFMVAAAGHPIPDQYVAWVDEQGDAAETKSEKASRNKQVAAPDGDK